MRWLNRNRNIQPPQLTPIELAEQKLKSDSRLEHANVSTGTWSVLDTSRDTVDMTGENGIFQSLHGVIKAGNDLFGVVTVSDLNKGKLSRGLIRFATEEGEQSTLVDFIEPGKQLRVNRKQYPEVSGAISREKHFAIEMLPEGTMDVPLIGVIDEGSTHGTEMWQAKITEAKEGTNTLGLIEASLAGNAAVKGLHKHLFSLKGSDAWALSAAEVSRQLESRPAYRPEV
jgi:hypothetical protein